MAFRTEKVRCAGCHGKGYLLHKEWVCKRCNGIGKLDKEVETIASIPWKWVLLGIVLVGAFIGWCFF
jgi:DnaJ-class molecular chaperone